MRDVLQHRRDSRRRCDGALRRLRHEQRIRALLECLMLHLLDRFGDDILARLGVRAARHDLGDELRPLVDLRNDRAVRKHVMTVSPTFSAQSRASAAFDSLRFCSIFAKVSDVSSFTGFVRRSADAGTTPRLP